MRSKNALLRSLFFIGWLLSPLTFWNDAFFNIPLSYIAANIFIRIWPAPHRNSAKPVNFLLLVLVFYWISNALGVILMYLSGKRLFTEKGRILREILSLAITLAVYSIILVLLHKFGILKPI
jgi:hypothetical protein